MVDLHTGAQIPFMLPSGNTPVVDLERGTIQGDSLSPLLFLVFMEPLLRWLHLGGRGYRMKCLEKIHPDLTVSSHCYAGDLTVPTSCPKDHAVQRDKIVQYGKWADLNVNRKKCGESGLLYGDAATTLIKDALSTNSVDMLRKRLQLKPTAGDIPFLHPDKDPYKCLGVKLTLTLNWKYQREKVIAGTMEKGNRVLRSFTSERQILQFLQSGTKPYITYSFPLAIHRPQDIHALDSILARVAERALNLPLCRPTALSLEAVQKAGVGVTSLMVDYAQLSACIPDQSAKRQSITRAMLRAQHAHLGGMQTLSVKESSRQKLNVTQHYYLMNQ